jgi:hypothetical protein
MGCSLGGEAYRIGRRRVRGRRVRADHRGRLGELRGRRAGYGEAPLVDLWVHGGLPFAAGCREFNAKAQGRRGAKRQREGRGFALASCFDVMDAPHPISISCASAPSGLCVGSSRPLTALVCGVALLDSMPQDRCAVRHRFDQLGKKIGLEALVPSGTTIVHEMPARRRGAVHGGRRGADQGSHGERAAVDNSWPLNCRCHSRDRSPESSRETAAAARRRPRASLGMSGR